MWDRSEMALLTTLVIISICIALVLWRLKNKASYWAIRGIQSPTFIEVLIDFKKFFFREESVIDRNLRTYQWIKKHGLKHAGLYKMWKPWYYPIDVNIIKGILQTDFDHFVDRSVIQNEKNDPLKGHLFSLSGKKWRLLRQKLTPTFSSGKMKLMFETVVDCTKGIKIAMDKKIGDPINIKEIAGNFTTDVIGTCAFGINCDSLTNPDCEFKEKLSRFFEEDIYLHYRRMVMNNFPGLMKLFNLKMFTSDMSDFILNLTRETIEYREKNQVRRNDFMDLMIQLKNQGKLIDNEEKQSSEHVSDEENEITVGVIAAQCLIFFAAGYETSSSTIAFCLYELAKAKPLQDKVRKEIKSVLLKHDGKLTYEALAEMKYLEQTVNETLRKYPPEPDLVRICNKDYHIPGTDILLEKGTKVKINSVGLQRDSEHYPEPEKFDPERFSDENIRTRSACTFLSFGQGPRNCIGLRFGMMQTKIGVLSFLLNYEYSPCDKTKEPFEFDPDFLSMAVKGGIWINFTKIST